MTGFSPASPLAPEVERRVARDVVKLEKTLARRRVRAGERALDEWRERGLDAADVYPLLADTLLAVVGSVKGTEGSLPAAR